MPLMPGLALVAALAALSWCFFQLWLHDPNIAEEDHLIEWVQAGCLGLAAWTHALRSRSAARASEPWFVFHGMALLTTSFLLDIDSWDPRALTGPLQSGMRLIVVLLWLLFARGLVRHARLLWSSLPRILGMPVVIIAFLGGCFYLASWPFEEDLFAISASSSKFIGQLLQFHACSLLFCSSLVRVP